MACGCDSAHAASTVVQWQRHAPTNSWATGTKARHPTASPNDVTHPQATNARGTAHTHVRTRWQPLARTRRRTTQYPREQPRRTPKDTTRRRQKTNEKKKSPTYYSPAVGFARRSCPPLRAPCVVHLTATGRGRRWRTPRGGHDKGPTPGDTTAPTLLEVVWENAWKWKKGTATAGTRAKKKLD